MFKQYKKHLILSSLGILLPILFGLIFWNRLPDSMVTHWGADGRADGMSSKAFAVFFLPVMLLAVHWLCLFLTRLDPRNKDRNRKPFLLVMWIMPVLSIFVSTIMYSAGMGYTMHIHMMGMIPLGLMFVVIGNYLPKCQQNHTIGIKLPWTLANEENWILTHRFGGKCWIIGGFLMMLCAFLPEAFSFGSILVSILLMAFIPMIYSWLVYRKHKQQGISYPKVSSFVSNKARRISLVLLTLLFAFLGWILFTGDIQYTFEEEYFTIQADFYTDMTVYYDTIETVSYLESSAKATKANGFDSARLLLGGFRNEEFGYHTRYTYRNTDCCVVLRKGNHTMLLNSRDAAATRELYDQLLSKIS